MKTFVVSALILLSAVTPLFAQQQNQTPDWKAVLDTARSFEIRRNKDSALHYGLRALDALKKRTEKQQDTNYAQALNIVSGVYLSRARTKEAEPYCTEAYTLCKRIYVGDHLDLAGSINNMGEFYNARGDYSKAEPLFLEALKMKLRLYKGDHPDFASSINTMGSFYEARGDYGTAESLYIEGLAMRRRLLKDDHLDLAGSINTMGGFYNARGDYGKAEPLFLEALAMKRRLFKGDHPDLATSINNMVAFYEARGDYGKTEPLYLEALAMVRRLFKGDHPSLATSINNMGSIYKARGDYGKAEPLYTEALAMQRRLFKGDHLDLVSSINSMGAFYLASGDYGKAEPLYTEALAMRRRFFKSDHPDLATSINNLGVIYEARGDYGKAEQLYVEALAMYRRLFKGDHPDMATTINTMGNFYDTRGDYGKAEPLFLEALAMKRRLFKGDHPSLATSFNYMGRFYEARGDFSKAEPLYTEALAMRRRLFKSDHPDLAGSINKMGEFYEARGDYGKAKPLYTEALAMYRRFFKGDHPDFATSLFNMGEFYKARGDYGKAEPLYTEALAMVRRLFKGDHPHLATSINNMGAFYKARGDYGKAEPLYTEALAMVRRLFKGDHPHLATSINNVGVIYESRGDYGKTETLYVEALAMMRRLFKGDHPSLATSINNIGAFYQNRGNYAKAEPLYSEALDVNLTILDGYFPSLSESEKQAFWGTMSYSFERYNSFACDRRAEQPSTISRMYDNQLATKGLLLSATLKVKSRIAQSGDTALIRLLNTWQVQKEQIAKFSKLSNAELEKQRVNLDSLENVANVMEKELSRRSEAFATAFDKTRLSWRDVQQKLKPDEAAVEIVRFRHFGFVPNMVDSAVRVMKMTDSVWYAALIVTPKTTNHPELVLLKNGNDLEGRWMQEYQQRIRRKTAFELDLDPNYNSYNQYWAEIGAKLKELGVKHVYLSPDGAYHQININTFLNPATKQYILDELDVRLLTSTRDLLSFRRTTPKDKSNPSKLSPKGKQETRLAELFGYPQYTLSPSPLSSAKEANTQLAAVHSQPTSSARVMNSMKEMNSELGKAFDDLPGAKAQIETISQTLKDYQWSVVSHVEREASEEAVKSLKSPYIVHIATHGFFLPDIKDTTTEPQRGMLSGGQENRSKRRANPLLRSGLALAGANNAINDSLLTRTSQRSEDGILTAFEAMNLDLDDTELVDLSACETGLGDVKAGEGVYGLQRAFRVAGAKALIMSLRPVNDEATQKLMSSFYRLWAGGLPKQEAFRAAQQQLRNEYPTPYYWGGFVMLGE